MAINRSRIARRGSVALVCAMGLSGLGVSTASTAPNPDATPRTQEARHGGGGGNRGGCCGGGRGRGCCGGRWRGCGGCGGGRGRGFRGGPGPGYLPPPTPNAKPPSEIRRDQSGKPYCPDVGGYAAYMRRTGKVCVCLSHWNC